VKIETGWKTTDSLERCFIKVPVEASVFFSEGYFQAFEISLSIMNDLLKRQLGLRKFTRRWIPLSLPEAEERKRVTQSRSLLELLRRH
jgi:hypothetical protein